MEETPLSPNPMLLQSGSVFANHYRVERCIKAGGMGVVYEVLDERTRRKRALKLMLPQYVSDPESRRRFEREVTVAAGIHSEHIVEVVDAGVDPQTELPFLVMELLKGEDLNTRLRREKRLSAEETVALLWQLALALERTHAAGVVHRDLKPENLFVTRRDNGSPLLKVLDFGIAKVAARSTASMQTTSSLGTPVYMSPEQVRGDGAIRFTSDLYALAQLAFTLLVGRAYFEGSGEEPLKGYPVLYGVLNGISQNATERSTALGVTLPPRFDAWFEKGSAPEPGARFQSASAMVEELATLLEVKLPTQTEVRARVPSVPPTADASGSITARAGVVTLDKERTESGPPRFRKALLVAIAAATCVLGLGLWSSTRDIQAPTPTEGAASQTAATATPSSARAHPSSVGREKNAVETSPTASSTRAIPDLSAKAPLNHERTRPNPRTRGAIENRIPPAASSAPPPSSAKPAPPAASAVRPRDPLSDRE